MSELAHPLPREQMGRTPPVPLWVWLAWRNLWRNPRRTWLTAGGIAFVVFLLVFARSLNDGTFDSMVDLVAKMSTGHAQLQHPDYEEAPQIENYLADAEALAEQARAYPEVQHASVRGQAFALVSSGERSFGAQILGIEPEREQRWSTLAEAISEGRAIERSGEAVIGAILARNIGVQLGGEVVVLGTAVNGGIAALAVEVVGVLNTGQAAIDRSLLQVDIQQFREAWDMPNGAAHQVLLITNNVAAGISIPAQMQTESVRGLSWEVLMAELKQMADMKSTSQDLFFGVVALIVIFSVVNTFMMVVFERTPEIGVLRSVGMHANQIQLQLHAEAFYIAILGCTVGTLLAVTVLGLLAVYGMPLPVDPTELPGDLPFPERIYPKFATNTAVLAVILMLIGTQLAVLVPALRARRLRPVEALAREE